jgi:hypothetical protein
LYKTLDEEEDNNSSFSFSTSFLKILTIHKGGWDEHKPTTRKNTISQWGKNWEKYIIPISQREMVSFLPKGENTKQHIEIPPAVPQNAFFSISNNFSQLSLSLFSPSDKPYISPAYTTPFFSRQLCISKDDTEKNTIQAEL